MSPSDAPGGGGKDRFASDREAMVRLIEARGVDDPRVLAAMRKVERHLFVPEHLRESAYDDYPLPIGAGQTISQPYIVALMTELALGPSPRRVLDVGTGCGYQAAVLAEIVAEVCSIEIVPELADSARERLARLGYANVEVRCGDGRKGWPDGGPFDGIVVACAPAEAPQPLIEQLAPGGQLVIPIGGSGWGQDLELIQRLPDGAIKRSWKGSVMFVPMVGSDER